MLASAEKGGAAGAKNRDKVPNLATEGWGVARSGKVVNGKWKVVKGNRPMVKQLPQTGRKKIATVQDILFVSPLYVSASYGVFVCGISMYVFGAPSNQSQKGK